MLQQHAGERKGGVATLVRARTSLLYSILIQREVGVSSGNTNRAARAREREREREREAMRLPSII